MSEFKILIAPPGAIDGPELERRLSAAGWTKEPSKSDGFVAYRCPVRYEHDRPGDMPDHHLGPDGHRRVSFKTDDDPLSAWFAVRDILTTIDRLFPGQPTCSALLPFVPWIGVETSMFAYNCETCGADLKSVNKAIRLSGKWGGGQWLCLDCGEKVGEMAAAARRL